MAPMGRIVTLLNQKGGVGKTTVTLGLASAAAQAGHSVLVVDLDPQGSSTWVLGHDPMAEQPSVADIVGPDRGPLGRRDVSVGPGGRPHSGLPEAAGSRGRQAETAAPALRQVADDYDAVLIDCPPSLGNLTMSGLIAGNHALIVVEPAALGLRGIGAVADAIDEVWNSHNTDLELAGVIVNKVPPDQQRSRPALRRVGPDRRTQDDLAAVGAATGDRQPGDRRTAPDPLVRCQGGRRQPAPSTSCG